MDLKAFISGCAGKTLSDAERRFFAAARPCGLILFARNCDTPAQLRALVAAFKDAVGSDEVLVVIDQEGGRVQRLKPPHWRHMPPARCYGREYETDPDMAKRAAFAGARLIAQELYDLGITVNTMPVLDVPQHGAHEIIGDRAYSTDPDIVIALGRAVMAGCLAGGVLPVIKHVPGHGRAKADSHLALPRIDVSAAELETVDFRPFHALRDAPLAMTAHVLLPAFDDRRPASTSPVIMAEVIRDRIGSDGFGDERRSRHESAWRPLRGARPRRDRCGVRRGTSLQRQTLARWSRSPTRCLSSTGSPPSASPTPALCCTSRKPFDVAEALALVAEAAKTQVASLGADPTVQA